MEIPGNIGLDAVCAEGLELFKTVIPQLWNDPEIVDSSRDDAMGLPVEEKVSAAA